MNFLGGSIQVGRLFGVNIRVHVLFVVWIGYRLLTAGEGWRSELLFLVMLFGTVLCHEFGHCFGARAVGGRAEDILMWPLGGLAYASAPMRPWPQFVTVACGPLVNVVFCIVTGAIVFAYIVAPSPGVEAPVPGWLHSVLMLFVINLFLLVFNLLPIFPLDGGQLFRTLLWRFIGLHRATIRAAQVGVAGAAVMALAGVIYGEMILIFIAIFGGMTSFQHYRAARSSLATEGFLRADAVMLSKRRRGGLWSRVFKGEGPASPPPVRSSEADAPSPRAEQASRQDDDAELERIRKKVAEGGPHSLTYVERQKLEGILRRRLGEAGGGEGGCGGA